ncbi:flagellar basal body P-ring formation chaperone FlgA [Tepidimonas charontis]|uniref:flagellar basal body P-ring formation chaperone FlgA n=1 Tax=Tepidimonas charontis TaxID=2267262 RepID=UPI001F01250B|nr:flagellar basal body P-ring formation chaperone FlgA [Tepidimonas charontis]
MNHLPSPFTRHAACGLRRWLRAGALGVALAAAAAQATPAATQGDVDSPAPLGSAAWQQGIEAWLDALAHAQLRGSEAGDSNAMLLRPRIIVGRLDSRLQLAPCARVEPFLPPGTRLWGPTRIGLRCAQGPVAWSVFLPVQVQVWGPAWVLKRPVPAGETLTAAHVEATQVDWTAYRDGVLVRPEDWLGRQATRSLAAGQVLRPSVVRAPQVLEAGQTVRLRLHGPGFELTATGEAMAAGRVGETVRVRLPNRRVLLGTVVDAQTVAIAL